MTEMITSGKTSPLSLSSIASLHRHAKGAQAWLLSYAPGRYFSMPLKACHEVLETPEVMFVPGIARYGLGLVRWRDEWLPLIDMNALVTGGAVQPHHESYCIIIAYRGEHDYIDYAALSLPAFPQVIEVLNDNICALPQDGFDWSRIARSCFRHVDSRVPIVDGSLLFTQLHQ